jgi:putative transposase
MPNSPLPWPHAPKHQLNETGTYFVTAATYRKHHHFSGAKRLEVLQRGLLKLTAKFGWRLEAWAISSNHYHFIAQTPPNQEGPKTLSSMLKELHQKTAVWINRVDQSPSQKIWHKYWDTKLSFQRSYLARLNYVHQNAVKHRLVSTENQYPWCSAQ